MFNGIVYIDGVPTDPENWPVGMAAPVDGNYAPALTVFDQMTGDLGILSDSADDPKPDHVVGE